MKNFEHPGDFSKIIVRCFQSESLNGQLILKILSSKCIGKADFDQLKISSYMAHCNHNMLHLDIYILTYSVV